MMQGKSYPILILLFVIILDEISHAQPQAYDYIQLREETGLAQDFVYSIAQDKKGFIWISTGKGLTRYDGRNLDNFTGEQGLAENFVTASLSLSSGKLLFGHDTGKLSAYNGVFFEALALDTLKSQVISLTEDFNGNVWCVSKSGGLIVLNPDLTIKFFSFPGELQSKIVNDIALQLDQMIVATNEGLYTFQISENQLIFIDSPEILRTKEITSLELTTTDSLTYWVGSNEGEIFRAKTDLSTKILASVMITGLESAIKTIVENSDRSLWVGTLQNGIYKIILNERFEYVESLVLNEANGYPVKEIQTVFIDAQEDIWVGTLGNGAIEIYPKYIEFVSLHEFKVEKVFGIAEGANSYYIATDVGMLTWAKDSGKRRIVKFKLLPSDVVISVFHDADNFLWIGTENNGIYKYSEDENQLKKIVLAQPDKIRIRARFFVQDSQGNIWISTIGQGIYKLNKKDEVLSHLSTEVGFIHNDIFAIHPDREGRIWFGSQGAGLARLDSDNSMQYLSRDGIFPSHDVNDITEDAAGNIWIATDGKGYYKYNQKTFENGGMASKTTAFIAGITSDNQNRIWLAYRKGISYIDLATGKQKDFTVKDGLRSNESYGSKIMVTSSGNVLICHESGVTILTELKETSQLLLKTYLSGVRVSFGQSVEVTPSEQQIQASVFPSISLPYNQNHLTFDFTATAINYSGPIYYHYYIKEFESTWSPPNTAHAITYSSLNPGNYTLLVQATNNLETWVDPILEYRFTIQKPYWQKWWFYLLQITGICTLFGVTYLLSRNEKTKTSILRVMVFTCLFIIFEFVQSLVEPIASNHIGQAPIFKSLINLSLAILLLPLERTFRTFFARHKTTEDLE